MIRFPVSMIHGPFEGKESNLLTGFKCTMFVLVMNSNILAVDVSVTFSL